MTTSLIFAIANVFVLPFWGLMILLPNWGVTQRVMQSMIPFVLLAGVYVYFFANSLNAESIKALSSPELASLARAFSNEQVMATGWTHYLVMDLFVGRWIYWEGQKNGVWTIHSLILCLFAGPVGLLSHLLTVWIAERWLNPTGISNQSSVSNNQ